MEPMYREQCPKGTIEDHNKGIFHVGQCPACYQSNVINPVLPSLAEQVKNLREGVAMAVRQLEIHIEAYGHRGASAEVIEKLKALIQ